LLAKLVAAAVELARNQAVLGDVFRHVGVEQQYRHAADGRPPDADRDIPVERRARDTHLVAIRLHRDRERRITRIDRRIRGHLLAVAIDDLVKIPLPVQQADGHERQIQIAGSLAVIACENAQAARIDREALVPSVLGTEIGDQVVALEPVLRRRLGAQVIVERRDDPAVLVDERRVARRVIEDALIDGAQEQPRTALDFAPENRVELAKQLPKRRIPAEPKIAGEIVKPLQRGRNTRRNLECEHAARHCKSFCWRKTGSTGAPLHPTASPCDPSLIYGSGR
jgi:hypothetical protein